MASKIVFLCALACAFHGTNAAAIRSAEEMTSMLNAYSDAVKELMDMRDKYGAVVARFDQVMQEVEEGTSDDKFSGYLSSILDMVEQFPPVQKEEPVFDMGVIGACVQAQRANLEALAAKIRERINEARIQLRQYALELLGPFKEVAESSFKKILEEIITFPAKIKECIEKGDLAKALEVIKETKESIQKSVVRIGEAIREAKKLFPEIRERAKLLRREIFQEAKAGLGVIHENIAKCVTEGGPKPEAVQQAPLDVDNLVAREHAAEEY